MLDSRLITYLEVCRQGSYTRAARELFITQPAATQQVQSLERQLGQKLLVYENRTLGLTPAGHLVLAFAQRVDAGQTRLGEELAALDGGRRPMPFGATLTIGEFTLSPLVGRLVRRFPDLDFRISVENTETILGMLDRGELRFALVEGFFSRQRYESVVLKEEPYIGVVAPDRTFGPGPVRLEDLTGETLILREPGSGSREVIERALGERNLTPGCFAGVIQTGSVSLMKELVRQGLGISFMYRDAARRELEEGTLQEIVFRQAPLVRPFSLVTADEGLIGEEQALVSFFLGELAEKQPHR